MRESLARLRFPLSQSRGRHYPESPHPWRNDFQRDRDRIVHSRAFRRMEDKTQVFGAGLSDHFRNRLTHTIEVSQISRTVAGALGLDEDFTEALALAHDIGHPPFAHAGENELNRLMARFGDGFNHNLHSLRIVDFFESRYARFPGLNLTFEVREGLVKHSRDLSQETCPPELREFLPGLRPPIEAQLIDLTDETAYNTADLDDGYSAGMFAMDEIAAAVPLYGEILEGVRTRYPHVAERVHFQETLRLLIDTLVSGLIRGTMAAASEAGVEDVGQVREHSTRLARFEEPAKTGGADLKRFLQRRVYSSLALTKERQRVTKFVARLFDYYLENPSALPESYQEQETITPHRVVCDYIAGMTDGFFLRTYHQIFGE